MVSKKNKRMFITCSPSMEENLKFLQDLYDMTTTQLVKMLLAKEVVECKKG